MVPARHGRGRRRRRRAGGRRAARPEGDRRGAAIRRLEGIGRAARRGGLRDRARAGRRRRCFSACGRASAGRRTSSRRPASRSTRRVGPRSSPPTVAVADAGTGRDGYRGPAVRPRGATSRPGSPRSTRRSPTTRRRSSSTPTSYAQWIEDAGIARRGHDPRRGRDGPRSSAFAATEPQYRPDGGRRPRRRRSGRWASGRGSRAGGWGARRSGWGIARLRAIGVVDRHPERERPQPARGRAVRGGGLRADLDPRPVGAAGGRTAVHDDDA